MNSVYSIGWFVAFVVSIWLVFVCVGSRGLTAMFPEGRRWWEFPLQLLSLALFAAVVLFHPFGGAQ